MQQVLAVVFGVRLGELRRQPVVVREQMRQLDETREQLKSEPEGQRSTTDPDARVMKMGDGGFRPAVNVQFATTCKEQVIVGMDVINIDSPFDELLHLVIDTAGSARFWDIAAQARDAAAAGTPAAGACGIPLREATPGPRNIRAVEKLVAGFWGN